MLVLSRKPGERIVLIDERTGEELGVITPIRIGPGSVRLAFDCPARVKVVRDELFAEDKQETAA